MSTDSNDLHMSLPGTNHKRMHNIVCEKRGEKNIAYAVKILTPAEDDEILGIDNLEELDILSRVVHPNIIHASKIQLLQNGEFAALLPLADRTLSDYHNEKTQIKLPMLHKIAHALNFFHQNGILHLDVKEDNVVVIAGNPYLIDFGLSCYINSKKVKLLSERISPAYRPPDVFATAEYSSASDVWSFGVMMLNMLSAKTPWVLDINPVLFKVKTIPEIITLHLLDPTFISSKLQNVSPIYREKAIQLLLKIFNPDPSTRPTMASILIDPLFADFTTSISTPRTIIPEFKEPKEYNPYHRDIVKLLVSWATTIYPNFPVKTLFLAIDLYNRMASTKDHENTSLIAAACLFMAGKLVAIYKEGYDINLPKFVEQVQKLVPEITASAILEAEKSIIVDLKAILYVSRYYDVCETKEELLHYFFSIIMSKDVTLYNKQQLPPPKDTRYIDGITIQEFLTPTS